MHDHDYDGWLVIFTLVQNCFKVTSSLLQKSIAVREKEGRDAAFFSCQWQVLSLYLLSAEKKAVATFTYSRLVKVRPWSRPAVCEDKRVERPFQTT